MLTAHHIFFLLMYNKKYLTEYIYIMVCVKMCFFTRLKGVIKCIVQTVAKTQEKTNFVPLVVVVLSEHQLKLELL